MLKLSWLGTISLLVIGCLSPVLHAQSEYTGPLDTIQSQTSPLAEVISSDPSHRIARLVPPAKLLPFQAFNNNLYAQPIGKQAALTAPRTKPITGGITSVQAVPIPEPTRAQVIVGEALPIDNAPPTFAEPITKHLNYPEASTPEVSGFIVPAPEDPTRFGYWDGQAFGFDNTRLYNPLEGPQLNLQGAPTCDFGPPGCDEWAGFGNHKDFKQQTACGGLKTNPGHLGIPWLGSNDNCDQTTSLTKLLPFKKRSCGCKSCQSQENYDPSCSTCSSGDGK